MAKILYFQNSGRNSKNLEKFFKKPMAIIIYLKSIVKVIKFNNIFLTLL